MTDSSIDLSGPHLGPDETRDDAPPANALRAYQRDGLQEQVVAAPVTERMLVVAGPGTGKTDVASRRLAQLVTSGTSPGRMLVLSFSRTAVGTLLRRLEARGDHDTRVLEDLRHVAVRTFDAWAFRILRLAGSSPGALLARSHDDNIKALTALLEGPSRDDLKQWIGDRRHVIIDEFQDLPGIRGRMVLALLDLIAPPHGTECGFTVLGDPAQAIYGFAARAGTDSEKVRIDYWEVLRARYGEGLRTITLGTNHRAIPAIADFTGKLRRIIERRLDVKKRQLLVRKEIMGLPTAVSELDAWPPASAATSTAILTRTNGEALRVAQALAGDRDEPSEVRFSLRTVGKANGAPPGWIAALLARARSVSVTRSQFGKIYDACAQRFGDAGSRAIGLPSAEVAWTRLSRAAGSDNEATSIDLDSLRKRLDWPDAFPDDQLSGEEGIVITTVHQAKGMEFDHVTLLDPREEADDNAEDAMFVDFVAATRAARRLDRLTADCIYPAPVRKAFRDNRTRRCWKSREWVNLEIGIPGDVDTGAFVDPHLFGSDQAVVDYQDYLLSHALQLRGHKVILVKRLVAEGKAAYDIHLQESREPGRLLGRVGSQLVQDLLYLLWDKGKGLPSRIMNLRIDGICTMTMPGDNVDAIAAPFRTSRLWLGIGIGPSGDFKTYTRKG